MGEAVPSFSRAELETGRRWHRRRYRQVINPEVDRKVTGAEQELDAPHAASIELDGLRKAELRPTPPPQLVYPSPTRCPAKPSSKPLRSMLKAIGLGPSSNATHG